MKSDIEVVKEARILFGHQSVGSNIIQGMIETGAASGGVKIVATDTVRAGDPSWFAHAAIGSNGNPKTKCDGFVTELSRLGGDAIQVAMMKFCFADFVPATDVTGLMRYYTSCVESTRSRHPGIRIVHITAPLLRQTPLWKRAAKRVLLRQECSVVQNLHVNAFNRMLLAAFPRDAVFDLARVESTNLTGDRCTLGNGADPVHTVVPEYTSDGGYLNKLGRGRAAAVLIHLLADVLRSTHPGIAI